MTILSPKNDTPAPTELSSVQLTVNFVRTKLGDNYVFHTKHGDAEKVVARLRVELSRLRAKAKAAGHNVRKFRLHVVSVEKDTGIGGLLLDKITVTKTLGQVQKVAEIMPELLVELVSNG